MMNVEIARRRLRRTLEAKRIGSDMLQLDKAIRELSRLDFEWSLTCSLDETELTFLLTVRKGSLDSVLFARVWRAEQWQVLNAKPAIAGTSDWNDYTVDFPIFLDRFELRIGRGGYHRHVRVLTATATLIGRYGFKDDIPLGPVEAVVLRRDLFDAMLELL